LIEGQLFMPESWFDEKYMGQREACRVPTDLKPKTKSEIMLELLKRAIERKKLPFRWVQPTNCMAIRLLFGMG
jgi:hypothetical protein